MEALRFSLKKASQEVILEGADGQEIKARLMELSGGERDSYLQDMSAFMKYDAAGKPAGLSSFEGLQAALLSKCLEREDGTKFTKEEVQAFPATVQSALFDAAQKLNALDNENEEEAEKND